MSVASNNLSDRDFRDVLGHFCTGLTVITAMDETGPVGFTCQSFQSVSLNPPLVSFAPANTSTTWPLIRRSGRFAANILAAEQGAVCTEFARSGVDKFAHTSWRLSAGGSPILNGVAAWIDCTIEDEFRAGDHTVVLGRVHELAAEPGLHPLLFYRGALAVLGTGATPTH